MISSTPRASTLMGRSRSHAVITRTFMWIFQDIVGFVYLEKFLFCRFIAGIMIRMILHCFASECCFYLSFCGIALDLKDLIWVSSLESAEETREFVMMVGKLDTIGGVENGRERL